MKKTLEEWKKEIDTKIDIARNEYIDWNFNILDEKYIEQMANRAEKRILENRLVSI